MVSIKNQVRDEQVSSLKRLPVIKEIMVRKDNVEIIQPEFESHCDHIAQKKVGCTERIRQSVSWLENMVHSLISKLNTKLMRSTLMIEKLDKIIREAKLSCSRILAREENGKIYHSEKQYVPDHMVSKNKEASKVEWGLVDKEGRWFRIAGLDTTVNEMVSQINVLITLGDRCVIGSIDCSIIVD